jgi:tetratricopeptide (TPR) repeat protein
MHRVFSSFISFPVALAVIAFAAGPATSTADQKPVRSVDPLTGEVTILAAPEPEPSPEEAAKANLSDANRMVREQDYTAAEALLAPLTTNYPDDPELHLLLGEVRIALKMPEEALSPLLRAAELAPGQERIQFQLGSALVAVGREEEALAAFSRETENTEDKQILLLSHMNRAFLLQQMKRWEEAAAAYETAAVLDPSRPQVYGDAASLYMQARKLDMAEATLAAGAANGFRSAQHYYSLGAGFYKVKRYDKAIAAYSTCLETNPEFARAERGIGLSLQKKGLDGEAITHYRKYLELKPNARDKDKILAQIQSGAGS